MEHTEAVEQYAVEKYLLEEFSPEARAAFEEHYFSCEECATDLRAAAAFIAQARKELARPALIAVPESKPQRKVFSLASFLQPVFAVPAMAAMLLVIGFQNIVTFPHLEQQVAVASQPRVLPSVTLVDGQSRGAEIRTVVAKPHESFLLSVDIPADNRYSGYLCSLYSPSGKMVWQLQIPPSQVADTVPIQVPADTTDAGENTLLIQGVTEPQSAPVDVVRYHFLLQIH